ncbi:MAG: hypothetical protein ACOYY3_14065 [Chloroflexota bacterium]
MLVRGIVLALLAVLVTAPAAVAQQAGPVITSPTDGQALQGVVQIIGSTQVDGFASAEVAFAYAGDPTGTWFLIASPATPVTSGLLAEWDTSSITDADYVLRLRVFRQDGSSVEARVTGLRVRNTLPVETSTPTAAPTATVTLPPLETPTPVPPTATPSPVFTPTALPPNPAALTTADIYAAMRQGALYAAALVLLFGLLMRLRRK